MSFLIPDALRDRAAAAGPEGDQWLDSLPARIADLERDWSITALRPFTNGCTCSWVTPVQCPDGSSAVLKINFPEPENRHEADALRLIEGRGAVRLLRSSEDGLVLLLERCLPGEDLWSLGVDAGNNVGATLLQRLWREVPPGAPFTTLSDLVQEWCQTIPREAPAAGYDPELVDSALKIGHELQETQPRHVLLHGDFHPGNALSAGREPWLAIDPKPLIGDPAYDLAQWIGNRCWAEGQPPEPIHEIRRQIRDMSDQLNLDPARVAGWAYVKSLGWDWGPDVARLLRTVLDG